MMKGPTVFCGYYKRPDLTEKAFDSEGWFHTGDVTVMYPNGTIKIVDRVKNIFKLSQGEYIAPEKVENIMVQANLVAQCLVCGDSSKDYTVAIVSPDMDFAAIWAKESGVEVDAVFDSADFKKVVMH